jgi:hypothetical protein
MTISSERANCVLTRIKYEILFSEIADFLIQNILAHQISLPKDEEFRRDVKLVLQNPEK